MILLCSPSDESVLKIVPIFRVKTPDRVNLTDSVGSKERVGAVKLTLFTTAVYWEDTPTNTNIASTQTEKPTPPTFSISPQQAYTNHG